MSTQSGRILPFFAHIISMNARTSEAEKIETSASLYGCMDFGADLSMYCIYLFLN